MKNSGLTVAFGCLGAPLNIGKNESRFNGSTQYTAFLKALVRNPNVETVIMLGSISKETEKAETWKLSSKIVYPLPKVHQIAQAVWGKDKKFPSYRKPSESGDKEMLSYSLTRPFQDLYAKYCIEKLPKIDVGFFFISQGAAGTNIAGLVRKKTNPEEYRVQLPMAATHTAPYIHTLNLQQCPWFMVSPDDRVVYSMPRHDFINVPLETLGQWHAEYSWDVCTSYEDGVNMIQKDIIVNYAAIEKLNLIDSNFISPATERPNKITLVANQSTHRNDLTCQRFQKLKSWILDKDLDCNIYGEWAPSYVTGYKELNGSKEEHDKLIEYNKKYLDLNAIPEKDRLYPQFKGRIPAEEVDKVFQKTRYTLCFPVIEGYLTWKWLEALMNGVLPFIPPFYDEQFNAIPEDSPLRVKSPEHFMHKIQWFEDHPEVRISLVQKLQNDILTPCRDGSYLYPYLNKFMERHNIPCIF